MVSDQVSHPYKASETKFTSGVHLAKLKEITNYAAIQCTITAVD
jgi:hypothetical protein